MDKLSVSSFEQLRKQLLNLPRERWVEHCRRYGYYNGCHTASTRVRGLA